MHKKIGNLLIDVEDTEGLGAALEDANNDYNLMIDLARVSTLRAIARRLRTLARYMEQLADKKEEGSGGETITIRTENSA